MINIIEKQRTQRRVTIFIKFVKVVMRLFSLAFSIYVLMQLYWAGNGNILNS